MIWIALGGVVLVILFAALFSVIAYCDGWRVALLTYGITLAILLVVGGSIALIMYGSFELVHQPSNEES